MNPSLFNFAVALLPVLAIKKSLAMAQRTTAPRFQLRGFPIYPPHSPKSLPAAPSLPFLGRRRHRSLLPSPRHLSLASSARRWQAGSGAPRASLPQQQQGPAVAGAEDMAGQWGKVSAVLFDMDGVLCNSEEPSRRAAVDVFAEMGVSVTTDDFVPFMGTGEANFLGGVASVKGVKGFDPEAAKKRFFEIYLSSYAKPNSGIGFPGALELIIECKNRGLKVAVASSADRIKVDANLAAAGLPITLFDAIVSADAFENLKPAPDIFLTASKILGVVPSECMVIEDALAGIEAANTAQMRCIAVTTTLTEDKLQEATPSLIRKEIGSVSIQDILYGGHSFYDRDFTAEERTQEAQNSSSSPNTSSEMLHATENADTIQVENDVNQTTGVLGGLKSSRREVIRYGSLGVAISCLVFTIVNRKAMQYASLKGLMNFFTGANQEIFKFDEGKTQSSRIQQIKNYLSDLEDRGSASTVPEFPSKLDWLNTSPLQFHRNLKGRVVVLDFWTYCCINCMHVLPDLEFLEKKYSNKPFSVVGVHSAKFDNEKDLDAIRNAVLRYGISHPVVNDGDMSMWRELGVNSWPTFVVVGPNGKILAQLSGEGRRKDLDDIVDAALEFYGERKLLENNPIPLALEKDADRRLLSSPLKFPGKVAIDVLNNRLFISDSNHNRIVVTDIEGNFITQIGATGQEGLNDGAFDVASFNRPQGIAYNPKKNALYVADTENHSLREIDFVSETVRTLAGNGIKGFDYTGGGQGTAQELNSPWDVCYNPANEVVYIAMAGQHQIWEHNTISGVTKSFSGDGFERNLNGPSSSSTSFAQPSGITLSTSLEELYVADSESSSIRVVNLKTGGSRLLAGGDPFFPDNLFRFGDHDGLGSDALFQHPLGVSCSKDGEIYITDSYNHKIKKLDLATRKVTTIAGTGVAGFKDGSPLLSQLSEPSGIVDAGNGRLLIADTNNNLIRYIDLSEKEPLLRNLELRGVQPPSSNPKSLKRLKRRLSADTQIIKTDGGSSKEGVLYLTVSVPEGYHFSKEARSKFVVEMDPPDAINIEPITGFLNEDGTLLVKFNRNSPVPALGRIACKVYYCKEDEVCLYQSLSFDISFQQEQAESTQAEINLSYTVMPKVPVGGSNLVFNN